MSQSAASTVMLKRIARSIMPRNSPWLLAHLTAILIRCLCQIHLAPNGARRAINDGDANEPPTAATMPDQQVDRARLYECGNVTVNPHLATRLDLIERILVHVRIRIHRETV